MWNVAEHGLNVTRLELPRKPIWRVPFLPGASSGDIPKGVFPSLFSTEVREVIEDFLTGFGDELWFEDIKEIVLDRRAGADLFQLRCIREGQEAVILLQKDKYRRQELNVAIGHILENLRKEGGNHLIDATYEGKVIVRKLSLSAGEGSSK